MSASTSSDQSRIRRQMCSAVSETVEDTGRDARWGVLNEVATVRSACWGMRPVTCGGCTRWARRAASAGCLTPGWKPVLDVVPVGAGCLDHAMLDREVSQVGRFHGVSAPWRLAGNLSPAPLRCPSVPCEAD